MVIKYNEVLGLITHLGDEENIQVSVKESLKGSLIAGGCCFVGGVLLGPPGLAIGGMVGGCAAWYNSYSKEQYRPISAVILSDLSSEKQAVLVDKVRTIVSHLEASDALALVALVQADNILKSAVISEATKFVMSQLGADIFIYKNHRS